MIVYTVPGTSKIRQFYLHFLNKIPKPFLQLTNRLWFVFLGKCLTLASIPFITQALGVELYGHYNYLITIASYAYLLANWGFNAKGIREIATSKNRMESKKIVDNIISARLLLWLLGGAITLFISLFFVGLDYSQLFYIVLAILTNFGTALSLDFFFYGKNNAFIPSLSQFLSQLFFFVLVMYLIDEKADFPILLCISVIQYCLGALIIFYFYKKQGHNLTLSYRIRNSFFLLKQNLFLGAGNKLIFFQNSIPILLIPVILSKYDLGIYSASMKFGTIVSLFLQSAGLIFSPIIAKSVNFTKTRKIQVFKKIIAFYAVFSLMFFLLLPFFIEPIILYFFGEEFIQAEGIMRLLAIYYLPIYPFYLLFVIYMNNIRKDKIFFKGALLQFLLTIFLTPLFLAICQLKGVVYSLSTTNFIVALYYLSYIFKYLNEPELAA